MRPHVPPSHRAAMGRFARWLSLSAGLAVAASCAVGPNYHRPKVDAAPDYKEAGDWKPSEPGDALSRGPWWEIFGDDALNQLEVRIDISNQKEMRSRGPALGGALGHQATDRACGFEFGP